jgi:hypothetical protein
MDDIIEILSRSTGGREGGREGEEGWRLLNTWKPPQSQYSILSSMTLEKVFENSTTISFRLSQYV